MSGFLFESPLLDSAVYLTDVIYTCICLRGHACVNEIRYGYGRQQSYNRNHNHNLNKSKTRFLELWYISSPCGRDVLSYQRQMARLLGRATTFYGLDPAAILGSSGFELVSITIAGRRGVEGSDFIRISVPPGRSGRHQQSRVPRYGCKSLAISVSRFSLFNDHCCLAPSICLRLLMQAFVCDCVRAFTKLGIAIAANRPMMATTIMISTRVKPDLLLVLIFIYCSFCLWAA